MTLTGARGTPRVLFRCAAGPRTGYGHVVRCVRLARAMKVPVAISVRGGVEARSVARRLGARTVSATSRDVTPVAWDALVVDDCSARAAAPWIAAARSRGVLSLSIHDLGLGAQGADIVVDGTVGAPHRRWRGGRWLLGPRFAVLALPNAQPRTPAPPFQVLLGLGGGRRAAQAVSIATMLRDALPDASIAVALGFSAPSRHARAKLAASGVATVETDAFGAALATADLAILGGGVSLYEACALGVPAIGVAIVRAQRRTIRAFAREGLAFDGGALTRSRDRAAARRIARMARSLAANPRLRQATSRRAASTIDGLGATRVADAFLSAVRSPLGGSPAREDSRIGSRRERGEGR